MDVMMHGAYEHVSSLSQYYHSEFRCMSIQSSALIQSDLADLPEHLQIGYEYDRNPWENSFMQDFVMVAEFSEHEGPRPLVSKHRLFKIQGWCLPIRTGFVLINRRQDINIPLKFDF